ncbi:AraC family transcriptional regulator [Dethiothermospora halolimnae]|uniref:AraC family transcriptional regulator n=1 Tax=Dethiothermospora halolimnae TaxID=3114390 RepID=UPI003CCB7981
MDYFLRVQRAIDFIEENLKEDISLEEISNQAYSSVSHFYRMFQITTGSSIKGYVQNRRLSQAAYELLTTEKRVIDIGLDYQFNGEETFIRAFTKVFGITPGKYRKSGNVDDLLTKITLNKHDIILKKGDVDMEPKFIKKEFKLIGVEGEVNFSGNFVKTIDSLQKELFDKLDSIRDINNTNAFIAYWYYKSNGTNKEPLCYYFAAVEVDNMESIPKGLVSKIIPESNYAVFNEKRRGEIAGPNGYAYKVWLPTSDKELNEHIPGDFEVYSDINNIGADTPCEIYIPIK